MKNPIFIIATITKRCPFSKIIIYPKTILCVFNKHQYNNFVMQITNILSNRLPIELIQKIIELTNYKKLIHRTGIEKFTNWNLNYNLSSHFLRKILSYESSEDSSDSSESEDYNNNYNHDVFSRF